MGTMQPMLATKGDRLPTGDGWVHEVKWDGIRALVQVGRGPGVRVWSRNQNDITAAWPELQGIGTIGRDCVLDGEIVALGDGVPSFGALADRMHLRDSRRVARLAETRPVTFLVFDVLRLDGRDVTGRPLVERRALLEDLHLDGPGWQVPGWYDDGPALLRAAEEQGLEGVVSKRLASVYRPGVRSKDWLKFPIRPTGSFVIGAYRFETGSDRRLGSVLVGEPVPGGSLRFRGKVGSGIAGRRGQALFELLRGTEQVDPPFGAVLERDHRLGSVWVRPEVVIEVQYLAWTRDGRLRQPAFLGVRNDLAPGDLELAE
ncbi:MAG TPA: non-homologous end-joining DNA ligase [Marmoricola sp.]|jgi:bifunctional non-homologous end joining protein LigD|nr:non-homologous end-joining DNA ligase [Marmoricola sp.]